jgi:hypothetical protein
LSGMRLAPDLTDEELLASTDRRRSTACP